MQLLKTKKEFNQKENSTTVFFSRTWEIHRLTCIWNREIWVFALYMLKYEVAFYWLSHIQKEKHARMTLTRSGRLSCPPHRLADSIQSDFYDLSERSEIVDDIDILSDMYAKVCHWIYNNNNNKRSWLTCFSCPQNYLPLQPPFRSCPDSELEEFRSNQPHVLLYFWATNANFNTDNFQITTAILRGQNIRVRRRRKGESKNVYIYYVNQRLEDYMTHLNYLWEHWPTHWKIPIISSELLRFRDFALQPLQDRMRALVSSRGNDARVTPKNVKTLLPPNLFFLLCGDYGKENAVWTSSTITIVYHSASDLDFLFSPSMEDLKADGTKHPYYGHELLNRWYNLTFEDRHAKDPYPGNPGEFLFRAVRCFVKGKLRLIYSRSTCSLRVVCHWVEQYKLPSVGNAWL